MGGALGDAIEEARSIGAEFRIVNDGKVIVRGLSLLPSAIQDVLRQNKAEVLEYLKFGHSTAPRTQTKASIDQLLPSPEMSDMVADVNYTVSGSCSVGKKLSCQLYKWAGDDPKRWYSIRDTLLKVYTPRWESIDARDILVAWAAANLALTTAQQQLKVLENLNHKLTSRERIFKRAREADVSFWGRLAQRLAGQIPMALSQDTEAAELIEKLCSRRTQE